MIQHYYSRAHRRRIGRVVPFINTKSLLIDGAAEFVNINSVRTSLAATTVGTFGFWYKPVDSTPIANESLIAFGDTNALEMIMLQHRITSGILRFQCFIGGATQWIIDTTAPPFTSGVWSHVLGISDGVQPIIKINNVLVAQGNTDATNLTAWFGTAGNLDTGRMGCINFNGSGDTLHANGNFDEPRFWDTNLNNAQTLQTYGGGQPIAPTSEPLQGNLIAAYRMGDDALDNYNSDTANEWNFNDVIGSNQCFTNACEEADVELDVPPT